MDEHSEKPDFFNSPIFILGLPRSGTSMIAGCLNICGAWTGNAIPDGTKENPKGFFEHLHIRENIIKPILRKLDCDPLGVNKLPPLDLIIHVPDLAAIIEKIITADGYTGSTPWLYKGVKMTLLWPTFAHAFPNARWVIVRRDKESIINSCLRTSFMRQHSKDKRYWDNFVKEYMIRLDLLKKSGNCHFEIWPQEVINGNFDPLHKLAEDLNLTFREKELTEFINPSYWRNVRQEQAAY